MRRPPVVLPSFRSAWADDLAHPLVLAAALVLALNDHLLKGAGVVPAVITGKLSDVAGLFVLPVVLTAATRAIGWTRRRDRRELVIVAALGALFAVGKLAVWPGRAAGALGIALVRDPTDLVALIALAGAAAWLRRHRPTGAWTARAARTATMAFAALACAATSRVPYPVVYPTWEVARDRTGPAEAAIGCARARIWIAKTGKEGVGVVVTATAPEPCRIEIREARLTVGTAPPIASATLPPPVSLMPDTPGHIYLPIAFDEQAAWNHGVREGALELTFETSAGLVRVRAALTQRLAEWDTRLGPPR